MHGFDVKIALL